MRLMLLGSLLALGAVPAIRAQEACIDQITFPEVGRWAEYRAVPKNKVPVDNALRR